eukprot:1910691-Pleurochrysis_carterae.AAC.1
MFTPAASLARHQGSHVRSHPGVASDVAHTLERALAPTTRGVLSVPALAHERSPWPAADATPCSLPKPPCSRRPGPNPRSA